MFMMVFTRLYTEQGVDWTDDGVYVAYIVGKECCLEHIHNGRTAMKLGDGGV